jgi:hypothetical protein
MACAVLPPSSRAARNVRSSFTTPLVGPKGTRSVVVLRAGANYSTDAAGEAVIEGTGTEFIDTATVRAMAVRQRLLDSRSRQLTLLSRSRLAVRVLHWFGPTEMFEAREGFQR